MQALIQELCLLVYHQPRHWKGCEGVCHVSNLPACSTSWNTPPHDIPQRPWQVLGTDLFYFDSCKYLILADYYLKFFFVRKITGQCTSQAVIDATKQIFSEQGIPDKVVNDNGRHFDSQDYCTFAWEWGFDHITLSPHFPQFNGFIERQIQIVKNAWKKVNHANSGDRDMALFCLRTTPVDQRIPSPAELLFSHKLRDNLPIRIHNNNPEKEGIYLQLQSRQESQKKHHDSTARDLPPLYKGQPVRILDHQRPGTWIPGTVKDQAKEPRSYVVMLSPCRVELMFVGTDDTSVRWSKQPQSLYSTKTPILAVPVRRCKYGGHRTQTASL